jgi:hypothetical protein
MRGIIAFQGRSQSHRYFTWSRHILIFPCRKVLPISPYATTFHRLPDLLFPVHSTISRYTWCVEKVRWMVPENKQNRRYKQLLKTVSKDLFRNRSQNRCHSFLDCRHVCKTCAFHYALQAGKQKEVDFFLLPRLKTASLRTNRRTSYRQIPAVGCKNRTEHAYSLCGENTDCQALNLAVNVLNHKVWRD